MGMLSKRGIRLALMTAGFVGVFVAVNAVPGAATPVFPKDSFIGVPLGHGALSEGRLSVKPNGQVVVTKNTAKPGGTSGWHSHPGGAIVVVQVGQITTYRVARNDDGEEGGGTSGFRCITTTYTAGHAFIERPGEPLNAKNNGSIDTIIYATFPGVPVDAAGNTLQRTDLPKPNPDPCPI
jgi:quercetin dioxygenase-like cupin family protein